MSLVSSPAAGMDRQVELLVHAGAPSSRKDDAEYKAQAEAYLSFQGTKLNPTVDNENLCQSSHSDDCNDRFSISFETRSSDPVSLGEGSQLAITASGRQPVPFLQTKQLSAADFWEGQADPDELSLRMSTASQDQDVSSDISLHGSAWKRSYSSSEHYCTPLDPKKGPSAQNDSLGSHPETPIMCRDSKRVKTTPALSARARSPSCSVLPTDRSSSVADGPAFNGAIMLRRASSEMPVSYAFSNITTEKLSSHDEIPRRSSSDPRLLPNSSAGTPRRQVSTGQVRLHLNGAVAVEPRSPVSRTPMNDTRVVSHGERHSGAQDQARAITPTSSALGNTDTSPSARSTMYRGNQTKPANPDDLSKLQALPDIILPPEAEVGVDEFVTHVTRALKQLAEELPDTFKPVTVARTIQTHERGEWVFDPSALPLHEQIAFWRSLEKMVGGGSVGWGVWCFRGLETGAANKSGDNRLAPSTASASAAPGLGQVRVYCWGELVRHIYLMLYVASHGQVRKLGLQWFDAWGRVVVQMRSR